MNNATLLYRISYNNNYDELKLESRSLFFIDRIDSFSKYSFPSWNNCSILKIQSQARRQRDWRFTAGFDGKDNKRRKMLSEGIHNDHIFINISTSNRNRSKWY